MQHISMYSSYTLGYYLGRYGIRYGMKIANIYILNRIGEGVVTKAGTKLNEFAKIHKIDSTNTEMVSENLYNCLEHLE